jgi:glycosyltransferase involved in cell wall biosynthesis
MSADLPRLIIIAPKREHLFTGGFIFNASLYRELRTDMPASYILDADAEIGPLSADHLGPRVLGIDSLYLYNEKRIYELFRIFRPEQRLFLCHFLPSIDPSLDSAEQKAWKEREKRILNDFDGIIVPSNFMKQSLEKRHAIKTPVFRCRPGTDDLLTEAGAEAGADGKKRLLTIAHISPIKNIHFLIDVLEGLLDLNWSWLIIGTSSLSPDYSNAFWERLSQSRVGLRTEYLSQLDRQDIGWELGKSYLFLFPSLVETYGIAAAESLRAGLPVIANRTGALPEIIEDGVNGRLLPNSSVEEWKNAIRSLLCSSSLRKRFSEKALERSKSLPSWESCSRRFREIISLLPIPSYSEEKP